MHGDQTLERWAQKASQGDLAAFDCLAAAARPAMMAAARSVLGGRESASDAVQEALLVAYKNLERLSQARLVVPWLCAIARRRALRRCEDPLQTGLEDSALDDLLRSRSRELSRTSSSLSETLDALDTLSEGDQRVIALAAWSDLTAAEVAHRLGVSESAAKWRLHAARTRLRKAIDEPHEQ